MKFSNITALLAIGICSSLVSAVPGPTSIDGEKSTTTSPHENLPDLLEAGTNVEVIGPLPFNDLKAIVDAKRIRKRGNIGGVYLCDNNNFQNSALCYYGIYPLGSDIHPDPYWAARISSAGPDPGTQCIFSNAYNCGGSTRWMTYPGGNLPSGINNNLWCFKCWAGPIGSVFRRMPVETAVPQPKSE